MNLQVMNFSMIFLLVNNKNTSRSCFCSPSKQDCNTDYISVEVQNRSLYFDAVCWGVIYIGDFKSKNVLVNSFHP